MVEETEKSSTAAVKEETEKNSSSMANPKEEESAGGNSDVATAPSKEIAPPPPARHPLEHAWTFWFDNPSAKSKQAAWGSSIRPIYTFSTVEDFWRSVFIGFYLVVRCVLFFVREFMDYIYIFLLCLVRMSFSFLDI